MPDVISSDLSDDQKNEWKTDPIVYNALDREFDFDLDAAASEENAQCPVYFTKDNDALSSDWSQSAKTVWINPPYGRGSIKLFMEKAIEQKKKGVTTVLLVPATLEAMWLPIKQISEIRVITGGRLSFYHPLTDRRISGNTKGSMIVVFRPVKKPLKISLISRADLFKKGR